jgi:hypothetical protein
VGGQLLLIEEQWKARCKSSSGENLVGLVVVVVAMVAVEVTVWAVGMAKVEVAGTRQLIHGKSGKKGAVLMGHPKSATSNVASQAISPENADPRTK